MTMPVQPLKGAWYGKNRTKQREHLKCGITKEERLKKETAQKEEELARREQRRREELIDRRDFCGIRQPTPYEAVKHIVKSQRWYANDKATRVTNSRAMIG